MVLYIDDLRDLECPMCHATAPNILFPNRLGYLFWCGGCNHEERILRDFESGQWYWFANRELIPRKAPVVEGAA